MPMFHVSNNECLLYDSTVRVTSRDRQTKLGFSDVDDDDNDGSEAVVSREDPIVISASNTILIHGLSDVEYLLLCLTVPVKI